MTEQGGAQSFIGGGGQNNLGPLFGEVGEARVPPGKQGLKLRTGGGGEFARLQSRVAAAL